MAKTRIARKADIGAVAWSIACPACGADLASPNGSLMWAIEDRFSLVACDCLNCGTRVGVPPLSR